MSKKRQRRLRAQRQGQFDRIGRKLERVSQRMLQRPSALYAAEEAVRLNPGVCVSPCHAGPAVRGR